MRELWRQQRRGAGGVGVRSCSGGRTGEVVIGVWRSSPNYDENGNEEATGSGVWIELVLGCLIVI